MLRSDNNAHAPYVFYGPKMNFKLGVPVRFKGRELPEWAMLAALYIVVWVPVGWAAKQVFSSLIMIFACRVFGSWAASSWLAAAAHRQFVNRERPVRYLARVAYTEIGRAVRSRGPFDPLVVAWGVPVWFVVARATGRVLTGPLRPVAWTVAWLVAAAVARRLVAYLQPAERYWRFHRLRLEARPVTGAAVTATVIPTKEICR